MRVPAARVHKGVFTAYETLPFGEVPELFWITNWDGAYNMKEEAGTNEMIVSRSDPALVGYAMRRHIPEVDSGNIEVKSVARIPGKRSRAAVWSKDFSPMEKQALIEVFKDSAEKSLDQAGEALKLAQELTGNKIEVKLVSRDGDADIAGV